MVWGTQTETSKALGLSHGLDGGAIYGGRKETGRNWLLGEKSIVLSSVD